MMAPRTSRWAAVRRRFSRPSAPPPVSFLDPPYPGPPPSDQPYLPSPYPAQALPRPPHPRGPYPARAHGALSPSPRQEDLSREWSPTSARTFSAGVGDSAALPLVPQRPGSADRPGLADASARAAAFASDYLSWDEDDPARRGRAIASHVEQPADEERLAKRGWTGRGRQRADLALSGTIDRSDALRVMVHVRVRVTPYLRRTDEPREDGREAGDVLPFPSAAPAPAAAGWKGLSSYWYEMLVPLTVVGGRWRVDLSTVWVIPPPPPDDLPDSS